jgi:ABC-type Fe3+ transport system substrate-binding protein
MSLPIQVIILNTKLVARKDYPRGWKDLANPRWKGKIIWANPCLSASAYARLFQLVKIGGWNQVKGACWPTRSSRRPRAWPTRASVTESSPSA